MDMVRFLQANRQAILERWDETAATMQPAASDLALVELRDNAGELLDAMVRDMRSSQSPEASREKARGGRPQNSPGLTSEARRHAGDRLRQGFTLGQLISEYRALRESVVRSWSDQISHDEALEQLARFHEAVDQALHQSTNAYLDRLGDARELLQGVLAHDLRDSLAAITITVDILRDELPSEGSSHEHIERIRIASARMHRMIDDLLDFARARLGGGLQIEKSAADLGDICETVLEHVRVLAPATPVDLGKDGDLTGSWDASRLEQMVENLVINAVRHGVESRPVTIRAQGDGKYVSLTVHNDGAAIPESQQKILFKPLLHAAAIDTDDHENRRVGLGLHVARLVAEGHGGSISLDSSGKDGTTFIVRLPR